MIARRIAIDGPAGAGKSTAAKMVAARLDYLYIDTGAMYRAIALLALRRGIAVDDAERLTALAETADIALEPAADAGCRVFVSEEEITEAIRSPQVGDAASPISAVPGVRRALVAQQQALAACRPVVMDGRDIGTVVLPEAECKVFLTAATRIRAERRMNELKARGIEADLAGVERDIIARDQRDSSRAVSPLRRAGDAILLDSSDLTLEQVVNKIIELAGGQA